MHHGRIGSGLAATVAILLSGSSLLAADTPAASPARALRDGFESARPVWRQEETDATIRLIAHDRSDRAAYEGKISEHFKFAAGGGSVFFYSYPLNKIPVVEPLEARVGIRANRAGVQLFGRVILPADTDPETGRPSFVLVPGPIYENGDRWQRLTMIEMLVSVERQARVIRASTKRPVSIEGAYLDRLVLNLYCGVGETEVFVDDLVIAPVPAEALQARTAPAEPAAVLTTPETKPNTAPKAGQSVVRLDRGRLSREGAPWVFTAIDAPGDVAALRRAGFSVLADRVGADPKRWETAIKNGFLLMPDLADRIGGPPDPAKAVRTASAFKFRNSVAFWNVGDQLGSGQGLDERQKELLRVRSIVDGIRALPEGGSKLITATVAGEFPLYARPPRNLDLMGVRPSSWGGSMRPSDVYVYLDQRRSLTAQANPGGLYWAWIPATAPPSVQTAIWGADEPPAWGIPQVQPEQVRMQVYLALAAGYRGIGVVGDAGLTEPLNRGRTSRATTTGRALFNEMALLNEEIDLISTIVSLCASRIPFEPTFPPDPPSVPAPGKVRVGQKAPTQPEVAAHPDIRAASIELPNNNGTKGNLLLVTSTAGGAQCQPNQMAVQNLNLRVVTLDAARAWEISPGGVAPLEEVERVTGGTRITLPNFSSTALVLVTTEPSLAEQIEARLRPARPIAIQLAIEEAEILLRWVTEVHQQIEYTGFKVRKLKLDPSRTFALAEEHLKRAYAARDLEDYAKAWEQARFVSHPLRVLMRAHWDQAVEEITKASIPRDHPDTPAEVRARSRLTTAERTSLEKIREKDRSLAPILVRAWSCPPAVAFNTLPALHQYWIPRMKGHSFFQGEENLVPSGSFDTPESLKESGWINDSYQYDGIIGKISTKPEPAAPGKSVLKLTVEPADPKALDTLPPFLDFPAAAIRSPSVPVRARDFLRISVLVKRPIESVAGMGGIVIRDSIGGDALRFQFSDPSPEWQRVVIYRLVPADGTFNVSLGLAGYGQNKVDEALFDDFRVEVLKDSASVPLPDVARTTPGPRRAAAPATAARPGSPTQTGR